MRCKGYYRAETITQALEYGEKQNNDCVFVAGCTDVAVASREDDRYLNQWVVDISQINELKYIHESETHLHIGSGVTHTELVNSSLIRQYAQILGLASATVGSPQIRNRGTIGGNIANASPAADTLPALSALRAQVILMKGSMRRKLSLYDVINQPYNSALEPGELIKEIIVDKLPDAKSLFYKVGRRNVLSISRLSIAAVVIQSCDRIVKDIRISVGSVFPKPMLFEEIHQLFLNKKPDRETISIAAKKMSDKIPEISGIRASTEYKQPVTQILCNRILNQMMEKDDGE